VRKTISLLVMFLFVVQTMFNGQVWAESGAPVTNIQIAGNMGQNGIYYGPVQVRFEVSGTSGSSTHYSIDGSVWNTYSQPFSLAEGRSYSISYYSVDANNTEGQKIKKITVKTDSTSPVTSVLFALYKIRVQLLTGNLILGKIS